MMSGRYCNNSINTVSRLNKMAHRWSAPLKVMTRLMRIMTYPAKQSDTSRAMKNSPRVLIHSLKNIALFIIPMIKGLVFSGQSDENVFQIHFLGFEIGIGYRLLLQYLFDMFFVFERVGLGRIPYGRRAV